MYWSQAVVQKKKVWIFQNEKGHGSKDENVGYFKWKTLLSWLVCNGLLFVLSIKEQDVEFVII